MQTLEELGARVRRRGAVPVAVLAGTWVWAAAATASAQSPVAPSRATVSVEVGSVWQARNDVRIPPDTGTEFSIVDLIGSAPTAIVRIEGTVGLTERQDLRFVYAPIEITGRGTPGAPIVFAGAVFQPTQTDAGYQFSSYRATWRYRIFQGDTWTWRVGFTGFVRDARIALDAPGRFAEDTDVGFVPLGHVSGSRRLGPSWSYDLELDAAAAPQGRALDLATGLTWAATPRLALSFGYRTVEGGADVDTVYTFAWLNAAYLRAGLRF